MARVQQLKIHALIVSTAISKHFALRDQMYRSSGSVIISQKDLNGRAMVSLSHFLRMRKGAVGNFVPSFIAALI